MTMQINFHDANRAEVWTLDSSRNAALQVCSADGNCLTVYVPPHVAEHTAAAFNRAMQAVPDGDGWTYTTKSGVWHISCPMPRLYTAQHDEITGDGDPSWMFADGATLIGVMDDIDDIESERACSECHRLSDDLNELDSAHLCFDCLTAEAERQQGMAEMAADDKAHAAMERAAGL